MNLSLEIAKKAFMATQSAMSVTANNIANVNTEGYSRQRLDLVPSVTIQTTGNAYIGTGVEISNVSRIREDFYDIQYRQHQGDYGYNSFVFNALDEIESLFKEPSDNGIKSVFNNFWTAMQELGKSPENEGLRQGVKENGVALANTIRETYGQLSEIKSQYTGMTLIKTNEVNQYSKDIQLLNDEIGKLTALGQNPNELLDKRDALVDKLSKVTGIQVVSANNNMINIITGGHVLVQEGKVSTLTSQVTGNKVEVKWDDGNTFAGKLGELGAAIDIVNDEVTGYQEKLDTLASDYIQAFNTQHRLGTGLDGSTGVDFFTGTGARDIAVSDDILNNVKMIAASLNGESGDNANIQALSELNSTEIIDGNKTSPLEYFDNLIVSLAIDTKEASRKQDSSDYILKEIDIRRKDVYGVSLDEEVTNMMNYQHAFSAASKILQSYSDMFDSLLSIIR